MKIDDNMVLDKNGCVLFLHPKNKTTAQTLIVYRNLSGRCVCKAV